ncbi:MAG TPA: hypothetical protein VFI02_18005 [Armatimonadota bacterium]|nr:hypothetical protein [Armatimonadota bacterium]
MEPKTFIFDVDFPGEPGAGLRGFTDTVRVTVESGDPSGDVEGEDSFQTFMLQALREWYDGPEVALRVPSSGKSGTCDLETESKGKKHDEKKR